MSLELAEVQRESSLGFHMVNTFQSCPRKWFVKYVCGILPTKLGKALIFGKAWHSAMEVFYKGGTIVDAEFKLEAEVLAAKESFRNLDEYDEISKKGPGLLKVWYEMLGKDLHETFQVLDVELELRPKVGNQFTMTIRPDAVTRRRSNGGISIPEHKTTSYSLQSMIETVDAADQATAYTWGLLQAKPEHALNFEGVLLDVAYNRGNQYDCQAQLIIRSKTDIAEFELSMLSLFRELARRILAIEAKPELIPYFFPRNGSACSNFGCEYSDICRSRIAPNMVLGAKYRVDPWKGRDILLAEYRSGGDMDGV